jgi:hypothetical protein
MSLQMKDNGNVIRKEKAAPVYLNKSYILEEDAYGHFIHAAQNGQTKLAVEYLVRVIEDLNSRIVTLEHRAGLVAEDDGELEEDQPEPAPAPKARKTPVKKVPEVSEEDV